MMNDRSLQADVQTPRVAMHDDQTLCTQLLRTITAAVPLQILQSKIPGAGTGVFVTKDVDCGEEIFRSDPVVNCVENEMRRLVCDYCYLYKNSKIHPSGRFREAEDPKVEMKACSGCKVCYYCSKVTNTPAQAASPQIALSPHIDCSTGLPKGRLEALSQD